MVKLVVLTSTLQTVDNIRRATDGQISSRGIENDICPWRNNLDSRGELDAVVHTMSDGMYHFTSESVARTSCLVASAALVKKPR